MIKISHAVLHAFDFEVGECDLSERELDLSVRQTKNYVTRLLRKVSGSAESRHGTFAETSAFAPELSRYLGGSRDFLDLAADIARYFYEELRMSEDAGQCDLLIADFEDTDAGSGRRAGLQNEKSSQMTEEVQADDEENLARRAFAVLLLPRRQTFVHDVRSEQGLAYNDIVRHDSALPNPTQKIDTYAVIDGETLDIAFHDVERSIAGRRMLLVPEGFLSCSTEASGREVIEAVERLVADVAEEYGIESAIAVSRAKSYVIDRASAADDVTPAEVGREVFQDNPAMAERYEQRLEERAYAEELPSRVSVRKGVATRLAKKHRIRTDTGIEVSFPSEYAASSDYIEFGKDETGKITIELKNIGRIENR